MIIDVKPGPRGLATLAVTAAVELNLEHYPTSVSTWILKGQLHLLGAETADAITAFERALELSPGNARAERLPEQALGG